MVINFDGDSLTINVALNTDVEKGYEVFSNKGAVEAAFSDGILSIAVNKAQLLKVVFDDSVGKTVYIFVGYKNFIDAFDVEELLDSGIASIVSQGSKGNVNYIYPLKTFVDNNAVYFDVSSDDYEYEYWYLAIVIEEELGVSVTMSDIKLEIFEVSAGLGDNEFNPF